MAACLSFSLAFTACKEPPEDPPPVHNHNWGSWRETTAPTCTTAGIETRTCTRDSSHTETQPIVALNHNYGAWTQTSAPTCTTPGEQTRVCSHDPSHKETRTGDPIDTNAHDWNDSYTTIAAATETTDGIEAITCKHNASHTKEPRFNGEYATGTTGLVFNRINNNTAYSVRRGTVSSGVVHIPAYHRPNASSQYLPVTEIGSASDTYNSGAFYNTRITAVTFADPVSLKTIGSYAFSSCRSLTSITIPVGITSIGNYAFSGCYDLKNITIDNDTFTTDGNKNWGTLFEANNLFVTFKKNIGNYAFYHCYRLTSVTIAEGVTSIGNNAFNNTALTSVIIPAGVTSIGGGAFSDCIDLISINIPEGVTSIGGMAFSGHYSGLSSITIPASVTSIGSWAFYDWGCKCMPMTSFTCLYRDIGNT